MDKRQQVVVQEQTPKFTPTPVEEPRISRLELLFRKMSLAAITMLGIGYILVNAPVAILIGYSISTIPITSQANISAVAGRTLFLIASSISIVLGLLLIYGSVQFYERGRVKDPAFLGVALGSFYLLCLGTGSTLLLSESNPAALTLTIAPLIMVTSAALYTSSDVRSKLLGSALGILSGVVLAYAILNLRVLDLVFGWAIPFTGPFLSFTVLESATVVLVPIAVTVHTIYSYAGEERPIPHVFALLVALVYGLGAFVGSIVLSLSFWSLIWQSPWIGPFHSLPEWLMNVVVFWSASLVLLDIGGILLIAVACTGFICIARELSRF
ncbi:MAG TPA: hypothetical protein VJ249_01525 [Candidatus Bathyarchaeia archaeon]|nr:hypothetical protein [Candidatus Bathyarchaeia archaeon]